MADTDEELCTLRLTVNELILMSLAVQIFYDALRASNDDVSASALRPGMEALDNVRTTAQRAVKERAMTGHSAP